MEHGAVSQGVWVQASHVRATTWRADRGLTKGPAKGHGIFLNGLINAWCASARIAMTAKHPTVPLVGIENDNMWFSV